MITVIIPTLNRPRLLTEALRSVGGQHYKDLEVIVVNDGGTSLEAVVEPWRRRLRLTLIELEHWNGVSGARNVGIDHASGEFIAFLDDDDVFLPQHLARARSELRNGADFVYTAAAVSEKRLMELPPGWAKTMHTKAYEFSDRFLLVANFIHTGSVVARNFASTPVRFDETLAVCEDWDLWIALQMQLGYSASFVDELTSIHHRVPGSRGLIATAQTVAPTPLSRARAQIHEKWKTTDRQVAAHRAWLAEFEAYRNERISLGLPVPKHLFDTVLRHLHGCFARGDCADYAAISRLFTAPEPAAQYLGRLK
ncbi:MAG TPA: glycosyltransferase family A protein [Gaiellaceae bacterium]|nr:glycosyltransferase family A protein [Gaiellaceae bacterium]